MTKVDLHVMIDKEISDQVKAIAEEAGISVSGVVNMSLKRCLPALWATLETFTPPPPQPPAADPGKTQP